MSIASKQLIQKHPKRTEILACSIVIAEDDMVARAVLLEVLESHGFKDVREAEHGQKALELIAQSIPDLVITDVRMPIMGGLELCQRIRDDKNERVAQLPILVLTGMTDAVDKASFVSKGLVTDYLTKPINADEVISRAVDHLDTAVMFKKLRNAKRS